MKASDVMTRRVVTVGPDTPIQTAIRVMLQHKVSGLPVVDADGAVVGVVTEGDFLRRVETGTQRQRMRWLEFLIGPGRMAAEYADTHGRKVADVMTPEPQTVTENTSLTHIVEVMERKRIKRLPVVRDGKLVGIVSRANLLHAVADLSAQAAAPTASDSSIRDQIMAELSRETWAPVAMVNVTVRDGIVDLWGTLIDERQRRAVCVAAENVPGVKAVRDHLVWEPTTSIGV
ncbi:MAG: CBS domain-containing protein [Alphaproteobacteria bacterium]|nr:CBS domain-containing protein [Alphaproteobacteria bacterium]